MRHTALALLLLGCGTSAPPPATDGVPRAVADGSSGCRLTDGTTAASGAVAPSTDGTNTCTCSGVWWNCTELAFHDPAPPAAAGGSRAHFTTDGTCATTDGTVAARGAVLPSDDGCNTCTCGAGGWECTEMACP